MKELGITLLIFISIISISIGLDRVIGLDLKASFYNSINPFRVMEFPELVIFFIFIAFYFLQTVVQFLSKKNSQNNDPNNSKNGTQNNDPNNSQNGTQNNAQHSFQNGSQKTTP